MFAAPDWLFNFANRTFNDPIPLMAGLGSAFWLIALLDDRHLRLPTAQRPYWLVLRPSRSRLWGNSMVVAGDWRIFRKARLVDRGAWTASVAAFLIILSLLPASNGNSLHRLYRDRLSTAFVFYERSPRRTTPRPGQFFSRILTWKKSREERTRVARANEKERPAARLAAAKASWSWLRRLFAIYDDERRKRRNSASDHNIVSLVSESEIRTRDLPAPESAGPAHQIINTAS